MSNTQRMIEYRDNVKVSFLREPRFNLKFGENTDNAAFEMDFGAPIVLMPSSDLQIWGVSNADNVSVKASFSIHYAKIYS